MDCIKRENTAKFALSRWAFYGFWPPLCPLLLNIIIVVFIIIISHIHILGAISFSLPALSRNYRNVNKKQALTWQQKCPAATLKYFYCCCLLCHCCCGCCSCSCIFVSFYGSLRCRCRCRCCYCLCFIINVIIVTVIVIAFIVYLRQELLIKSINSISP